MTLVSFDVGKYDLVGIRTDHSAKPKQSFFLPNEQDAISLVLKELLRTYPGLTVVTESTGDYHRHVALACFAHAIPFWLLNPLTTKQFTRATVRKKKTDLSDALIIAKLRLQGEGYEVTPAQFTTAKPLLRTACHATELKHALGLMRKRFTTYFTTETEVIAKLGVCEATLTEVIETCRDRANQACDPKLRDCLMTIPGIGPVTAATLITEIGTIDRFKSAKSLVAYSGLDPKVSQSGALLHRNTKLTKRGSPYLRKALFQAASVAQRYDEELKTYAQTKRDQGRQYREITVMTARKLLYRVYAVWKRGTAYEVTRST